MMWLISISMLFLLPQHKAERAEKTQVSVQGELTQLHGLVGEVKTLLAEMRDERAQMKNMMAEKNVGQIQQHQVVTGAKMEMNKTKAVCTPLDSAGNPVEVCDLVEALSPGDPQPKVLSPNGDHYVMLYRSSNCVPVTCPVRSVSGFTNNNIGGLSVSRCVCGMANFGYVHSSKTTGGAYTPELVPYTGPNPVQFDLPYMEAYQNPKLAIKWNGNSEMCRDVGKPCLQVSAGKVSQMCLPEGGDLRAMSSIAYQMKFTDADC